MLFKFETRSGQEVDDIGTKSGTRSEQEVVSKIKHIQTGINNKNNNKQEFINFEKLNSDHKPEGRVPYQDNLKTKSNKKYDVPL